MSLPVQSQSFRTVFKKPMERLECRLDVQNAACKNVGVNVQRIWRVEIQPMKGWREHIRTGAFRDFFVHGDATAAQIGASPIRWCRSTQAPSSTALCSNEMVSIGGECVSDARAAASEVKLTLDPTKFESPDPRQRKLS